MTIKITHFLTLLSLSGSVLASSDVYNYSAELPKAGPENLLAVDTVKKSKKKTSKQDKKNESWLLKGISKETIREDSDPLEGLNRPIYEMNRIFVDGLVVRPLSVLYRDTVHEDIKKGVGNFLNNIFMPLQFINHVLQGEGRKACRCVGRFVINTTSGVFGVGDVAKDVGLHNQPTTFNHTLAKWGVDAGPYVMLPILGPTTYRGAFGMLGDYLMNPLRIYAENKNHYGNKYGQQKTLLMGLYGLSVIKKRSELISTTDDIDRTAKDRYVSIRNYVFQTQEKVEREAFGYEEPKKEQRIGMINPIERA